MVSSSEFRSRHQQNEPSRRTIRSTASYVTYVWHTPPTRSVTVSIVASNSTQASPGSQTRDPGRQQLWQSAPLSPPGTVTKAYRASRRRELWNNLENSTTCRRTATSGDHQFERNRPIRPRRAQPRAAPYPLEPFTALCLLPIGLAEANVRQRTATLAYSPGVKSLASSSSRMITAELHARASAAQN